MKKILVLFFLNTFIMSIFAQGNSKTLTSKIVDELCSANGMTRKTITELIIPDEYTIIGDYAFEECKCLKNVKLPSGITQIGNGAFGRTSITNLTFPSNIVAIGNYPFGKSSLKTLTILAKTPPKLSQQQDTFYTGNMNRKIIIYVLNESLEKYKNSWKNQSYIQIEPISSKE